MTTYGFREFKCNVTRNQTCHIRSRFRIKEKNMAQERRKTFETFQDHKSRPKSSRYEHTHVHTFLSPPRRNTRAVLWRKSSRLKEKAPLHPAHSTCVTSLTLLLLVCLTGRERLCNYPLKSQFLLFQVVSPGVFNLQLGHSIAEGRLDLLLLATLELDRCSRVRNHLFNTGNVGLELLSGLKFLAKSLVARLKFSSI